MRILRFVRFFFYYLVELVKANLRIAIDVLTPGLKMNPGFIAIPLRTRTDTELLAFVHLVTMTPGTLCLDVSSDKKTLFIHAVYIHDLEDVRRNIAEKLQTRVLEVLR